MFCIFLREDGMFGWYLPINTEGIIKDADTTISLWMIEVITLVLADVYTVSQDWGNLFFKLALAETLKEVATRVAEEAWLYNVYAFYISFDYIHCFCFNFCCYNKIFRIPPSPFPKGAPPLTKPSSSEGRM